MAVNTENRRRSAGAMIWMPIAPTPDGATMDSSDRRQITGIYSGITTGTVAAVTPKRQKGLLLGIYP